MSLIDDVRNPKPPERSGVGSKKRGRSHLLSVDADHARISGVLYFRFDSNIYNGRATVQQIEGNQPGSYGDLANAVDESIAGRRPHDEVMADYIIKVRRSLAADFAGLTFHGNPVDISNVKVIWISADAARRDLPEPGIVIDVGIANPAHRSEAIRKQRISSVSPSRERGYFYLKENPAMNGQEVAHELCHLLGLSDRYYEAVSGADLFALYGSSYTSKLTDPELLRLTRSTIPISFDALNAQFRDPEYDPLNNLMSSDAGGAATLTEAQLSVIFSGDVEPHYERCPLILAVGTNPAVFDISDLPDRNDQNFAIDRKNKSQPTRSNFNYFFDRDRALSWRNRANDMREVAFENLSLIQDLDPCR